MDALPYRHQKRAGRGCLPSHISSLCSQPIYLSVFAVPAEVQRVHTRTRAHACAQTRTHTHANKLVGFMLL